MVKYLAVLGSKCDPTEKGIFKDGQFRPYNV
jgi:hypothetical protein